MVLSIGDLVARTGVAPRTLRTWISLQLVPPPEGTGSAALYGREHLARIWAVLALKKRGLRLELMGPDLEAMSLEEMEQCRPAHFAPPPAPVVAPPTPATVEAAPSSTTDPPAPAIPALAIPAPATLPGRRFTLVPLMPGLALQVDDGASALVQRMAEEIVARYAAALG